jgi:signal peptide peptidase SppA
MNKSILLRAFMETPWAILPSTLATLEEIMARHVAGEKLSQEEISARIQGAARSQESSVVVPGSNGQPTKTVAILPLSGTIFPKANMVSNISTVGTSAELFGKQFMSLVNDPAVNAIILDVHSPGGSVYGIEELSNLIFEARGKKPIVAVSNHMMASAAYWIGSAADEIVLTPSGDVGSIGVFAVHEDISASLAEEGVKLSIIKAGKYKTEGNPYEALSEEARAAIQASVDESYDAFTAAVARNRGVDVELVRSGFGEGRLVSAANAVDAKMADRIGTLDETVDRLFDSLLGGNGAGQNALRTGRAGLLDQNEKNTSGGQVPAADRSAMQEARARLEKAGNTKFEGESTMYARELMKQRDEKLSRAQALFDNADKENRDMTDAERVEFNQIMGEGESAGEVGALDAQIARIEGEREKLRAAAEKKFTNGKTEKPESGASGTMKMADFRKSSPADQMAFIKNGGKLED